MGFDPLLIGLIQNNYKNLDDLYKAAEKVLSDYKTYLLNIMKTINCNPDEFALTENGEKLMLDKTNDLYFKLLTIAPLKSKKRCEEKIKNEYKGNVNKLLDIIRCSIIAKNEDELNNIAKLLKERYSYLSISSILPTHLINY